VTAVDAELNFATAEHLAGLIRSKALSPAELMDHTLARIADLNPRIGAFVALDEERARTEAAAQTERIAAGEDLGPLGGLPFGVKDLEDADGFVTTKGSRAYRDNLVDRDSVQVERLRAAGAILLGKTNTPEFGHTGISFNELFPATRNPWNLDRTSGGSSGGTSAAIASGMTAIGTASDGAGSVRIPACFVGAFGLKVSFGRIPIGPSSFTNWMDTSVYGPLTRTVRDGALFLDQVVGYHPSDPDSLPDVDASYLDRLDEPLPKLRIGFNPNLGGLKVQSDVAREVAKAAAVFEELGHEVVECDDELPEMLLWWARIGRFQALASMWDVYTERRDEFGEAYLPGLDFALGTQPVDFGEFARLRAELNNKLWELFEQYDLLLTPTMPIEAVDAEGPIPQEVEGERYTFAGFTVPFNFSGHPAATVRAGFTDGGLPAGLQIAGRRHRDDVVLQASYAYEQVRPWNDHWPEI
jgi:aspartyl-tRNA(Asn)/glutamyl-tRNA(Gln) amidotransferase subunit A